MPLAGAFLADRGAVLESVSADPPAALSGLSLSRVKGLLSCARMEATWTDVAPVFAGGRVAFVAGDRADRGPVVVFLSADRPFDVVASGWPVRAGRGFHLRRYDREHARDAEAMAEEASAEALDGGSLGAHRYAARLLVFRTPDAPESLAFEVTAPVGVAVARLQPAAGATRVLLCPSVPAPDPGRHVVGP
jgi:hypothetical protein